MEEVVRIVPIVFSYIVKAATVGLGLLAIARFWFARGIYRSWSGNIDAKIGHLKELTNKFKKDPRIFLSYSSATLKAANESADVLSKNGIKVVMFDPTNLWEDAAGEVIEAIETASAVVFISGFSEPSDWIHGELTYARNLGVPTFEFGDAVELRRSLSSVLESCKSIDLVERLRNLTETNRFHKISESFESYIDNDKDHYFGSEFVSRANWRVNQGDKNEDLAWPMFVSFVNSIVSLLGAIVLGLIWIVFL